MAVSALRTIVVPALSAEGGNTFLSWGVANISSGLDYSLDISALLADVTGDTIVSAQASVAPSGAGELVPSALAVSGSVITLKLTGGYAARRYSVKIQCTTNNARVFVFDVYLDISTILATATSPPPTSYGFGTPVNWSSP